MGVEGIQGLHNVNMEGDRSHMWCVCIMGSNAGGCDLPHQDHPFVMGVGDGGLFHSHDDRPINRNVIVTVVLGAAKMMY